MRDGLNLTRGGQQHRLHARRDFHGKPRFDFIEVAGGDAQDPWFARLMGLCDVHVAADVPGVVSKGWISMALVQWLRRDDEPILPTVQAYSLTWGPRVDAVFVDDISRPVRFVTSPVRTPAGNRRFLLPPHSGHAS